MANNVLVTGCSSGFGLLAALRFARNGDRVFATMRAVAKAGELERARDAEKLDIRVLQLDVTDDASVRRAVAEAEAAGPLDVVVNNAGAELRGPVELASDDEIRWQFDTNVFGVLRVQRAALPGMKERRRGAIINLSSLAGVVGVPYGGLYAATKHALEALTESLYWEAHPYGIRVALIEPGAFPTGFRGNIRTMQAFTPGTPYHDHFQAFEKAREKLAAGGPQDPEDVAKAIVDAAYSEQPKLRYLVGADAQMIGAVKKQMDFEGFAAAMRKTLDFWD